MKTKFDLFFPAVSTGVLLVLSFLLAVEAAIVYFILFMLNLIIILTINSEYNMVTNNTILNSRRNTIISLFVSTIISFLTFSNRNTIRYVYFGFGIISLFVAIMYTFVLIKKSLTAEEKISEIEFDEQSSKILSKLILSNIITIISISLVYFFGIESILNLPVLWIPFFGVSFFLFDSLSYAVRIGIITTRKDKVLHLVYFILFFASIALTILIRDFHGKPLFSPIEFILIFSLNLPYYLATDKKRKNLMQ